MRSTFSNLITVCAQKNPNVYLLTGDHGYALFDQFRKNCEKQFINAGVAEQNMVGVAAGLAKAGLFPIVYGLSAFVPVRVLEQIKMDFCYEGLPGIFIGDGAGVVYSVLGASHQSFEDIAALRGVPNIVIMSPADKYELEACFQVAQSIGKPVYLRLGKADVPSVHQSVPQIEQGKLLPIQKNSRTRRAIVATGSMLSVAQKIISSDLKDYALWSAPLIKPLNSEAVAHQLAEYDNVISLEEHSVYGGLGSSLAEILAAKGKSRLHIIGINDKFSELCGSYEYLMKYHGLDPDSLISKVRELES